MVFMHYPYSTELGAVSQNGKLLFVLPGCPKQTDCLLTETNRLHLLSKLDSTVCPLECTDKQAKTYWQLLY